MFLRQRCPSCNHEAEFVYEQVGHSICCKKCNYEFTLEKKRPPFLPYLVWGGLILVILGVAGYFIKVLHDWWIYTPKAY
jgi:hypothetical protein